jgi:hypothetical protein
MIGLLCFVLAVLASPFKSKLRLEVENAVLRHQLNVVRRRLPGRVRLTNHDRWFLIQLYRWFPSILQVLTIIRPDTLVRWHRAGFRCVWRWKSRPRCQSALKYCRPNDTLDTFFAVRSWVDCTTGMSGFDLRLAHRKPVNSEQDSCSFSSMVTANP